ncbi:hypothetical protein HPB49_018061 [Dermacentor silvarum]|uniref:Uncharacterized protein n=1 Tax=Dermacentor silvarum TaxID=543639 RepID=A0ACB8C4Q8_DERSI|nr:hypothetical protein HPB49_018061 [Dermacentor silvarum]
MSKPRNRTTKKPDAATEEESGMVQCGNCEGWTHLEDSPFSTLEEAEGKTYTCRDDRPSALLFQARTGSFATQQRRHELFDSDPSCRLCGAPEETIAHVLQVCPCLHDEPRTSPSLTELLGLSGQMDEAQIDRIQSTKSLLLRWERLCRQTESSPTGITPNTPPPPTAHTGTPPLGHRCEDDGRAESRVEPSPILSQHLRGAHSDLPLCH